MGFWIAQLYQVSVLIFFMVLTSVTSMMLEHLIDQLSVIEIHSHGPLSQNLLKWKRNFGRISHCIDKINDFFGVVLLCFLTKQLVNIIAYTYWLIRELRYSSGIYPKTWLIFYIIRAVIYVVLTTLVSHRVKQKVVVLRFRSIRTEIFPLLFIAFQVLKTGQQLHKLKFSSNAVQCQVNSLKEMCLFITTITFDLTVDQFSDHQYPCQSTEDNGNGCF